MYLIYDTEEEGLERADQEGLLRNLPYHRADSDGISRYHTIPMVLADGNWGLDVSDYTLTEEEQSATVSEVQFPPVDILD